MRQRYIYVATSWRNHYQPEVVKALRAAGHKVYDFRNEGFGWSEIDINWRNWDIKTYIDALGHSAARAGFNRDMLALTNCDVCVYVMPCGPSASMEMGWAVGAHKPVVVYIPKLREPDLMVKMADLITDDINEVLAFVSRAPVNESQDWDKVRQIAKGI